MAKIGVFDSGLGGLSVAEAIKMAMPQHDVIFMNDNQHMPYGDKPLADVRGFVLPILQKLVDHGCDCIVVACNTVTTNFISELRDQVSVPLIGIEPMVKPAAEQTKTGVIAVCATPRTLQSPRYDWLKQTYAADKTVLEPDCSQWAYMIEHNKVNDQVIADQIDQLCDAGADVIVLGCTHYHWIQEKIQALAKNRAVVIQPERAVITQVHRVLAQRSTAAA
ncbi:MAG TPA: glutamate racemase [Candidatus Saccharimonadales bacterium]|nr:glutamate racemase [Candidatus Saccharimonadales bacterium]